MKTTAEQCRDQAAALRRRLLSGQAIQEAIADLLIRAAAELEEHQRREAERAGESGRDDAC